MGEGYSPIGGVIQHSLQVAKSVEQAMRSQGDNIDTLQGFEMDLDEVGIRRVIRAPLETGL